MTVTVLVGVLTLPLALVTARRYYRWRLERRFALLLDAVGRSQ